MLQLEDQSNQIKKEINIKSAEITQRVVEIQANSQQRNALMKQLE